MADAIFSGLKLLKDIYRSVKDMKKKLKLTLREIERCKGMMVFILDNSRKVTKHVRQSGDAALAKTFAPILDETSEVVKRITPLLRRKATSVNAIDAVVKLLTKGFCSAHTQIWHAQMCIKGAVRLFEKALECRARAAAKRFDGGLVQLELELTDAASRKARGAAAQAAAQQAVLATRLSPAGRKVAAAVDVMKRLTGMLKAGLPAGEPVGGEDGLPKGEIEDPSPAAASAAAIMQGDMDAIKMLLTEQNLVKLVKTVFRKQLGILSHGIDESAFVKLLGDDNAESAKLLYNDVAAFCGGAGAGGLDEEGIVAYLRERAEQNAGLLISLAASHVEQCVREMAGEDSLAGKLAELGETILAPIMAAVAKVGFTMAALTIPPPPPSNDTDDTKTMDSLIALAKDMAMDISAGDFAMSMFTSIESIGMPASFDIESGVSMLGAVMQGTALNGMLQDIKSYREELDEAARLLNMQTTMQAAYASTSLVSGTSRGAGYNAKALSTMSENLSTASRTQAAAQLVYSGGPLQAARRPSTLGIPRAGMNGRAEQQVMEAGGLLSPLTATQGAAPPPPPFRKFASTAF